jgi:hypothetical protein
MARKLAIVFVLIYTIFFIYQLFISETSDVSLIFAYLNFPTTLVTLKIYDILLSIFQIKHKNIIINDIVVYLSGAFQYGLIGYFLEKFI